MAIIENEVKRFESVEEKFDALMSEWHRLRQAGSSTGVQINDAYGQIVAMGWDAVPYLLREIERQSGHWFTAMRWITGVSVVPLQKRGNVRALRDAWLQWGAENGYRVTDVPRRVDEAMPAKSRRK